VSKNANLLNVKKKGHGRILMDILGEPAFYETPVYCLSDYKTLHPLGQYFFEG
jgi:hypothetical protein